MPALTSRWQDRPKAWRSPDQAHCNFRSAIFPGLESPLTVTIDSGSIRDRRSESCTTADSGAGESCRSIPILATFAGGPTSEGTAPRKPRFMDEFLGADLDSRQGSHGMKCVSVTKCMHQFWQDQGKYSSLQATLRLQILGRARFWVEPDLCQILGTGTCNCMSEAGIIKA